MFVCWISLCSTGLTSQHKAQLVLNLRFTECDRRSLTPWPICIELFAQLRCLMPFTMWMQAASSTSLPQMPLLLHVYVHVYGSCTHVHTITVVRCLTHPRTHALQRYISLIENNTRILINEWAQIEHMSAFSLVCMFLTSLGSVLFDHCIHYTCTCACTL